MCCLMLILETLFIYVLLTPVKVQHDLNTVQETLFDAFLSSNYILDSLSFKSTHDALHSILGNLKNTIWWPVDMDTWPAQFV